MPRSHRVTAALVAMMIEGLGANLNQLSAQVSGVEPIVAAMKSELGNLVTSQEAHFADYATYASALGSSPERGIAYFIVPPNTTIVLSNVNQYGWTGVMTNPTLAPSITCGVYVGGSKNSPNSAVKHEGAPACWGEIPSAGSEPRVPAAGSVDAIIVSMKTDLRNLVVSQEAYFADNNGYAPSTGPEPKPGVAFFRPSGKNVLRLSNVTPMGWTGAITNPALTTGVTTCGIYIGPPRNAPNAAVTQEGAPACWEQ